MSEEDEAAARRMLALCRILCGLLSIVLLFLYLTDAHELFRTWSRFGEQFRP